jgi:hypothetical protein
MKRLWAGHMVTGAESSIYDLDDLDKTLSAHSCDAFMITEVSD